MESTSTGLAVLFRKPLVTLLVLVSGLALAAGICFSIEIVPLALGVACFMLLLTLSRLKTTNLFIAFIVADHLCQFLKRSIFLLGPQSRLVYWGFQLLPTLILFCAVASSLYAMRKTVFPLSTKILITFIAIAIAQTFFNPNGNTLVVRFAASNQAIVPLFAAFVGMTYPPSEWRRAAKLFLILIGMSSLYGVLQFVHGPTMIDQAWALQTGKYSIEAAKVFAYITGARGDFRPYSYYSDPGSWGFFLILGTIFIVMARQRTALPSSWFRWATAFAVIGMVVAETRAVWVALFGALFVHWLLESRALRHPLIVITGGLVAFGLVLSIGQYALAHRVRGLAGSGLLNRYTDVGTVSARLNAVQIFIRVLPSHIVLGDGYGTVGSILETVDESRVQASDYYSHNAIVGLLLSLGLPGLLAFGTFIYRWLWEGLRTVNLSSPAVARSQLWIVSSCVGMLFTGALEGPLFLTSPYFMVFMGFGMGETMRLQQRFAAERSFLAFELNRVHTMTRTVREANV